MGRRLNDHILMKRIMETQNTLIQPNPDKEHYSIDHAKAWLFIYQSTGIFMLITNMYIKNAISISVRNEK